MRKTVFALAVISIFLFNVLLEVQPLVKANPYTHVPIISFLYPDPSWECCYSNASVPLKIGILLPNSSVSGVYTPQISYSLDNGNNITLTNLTEGEHWAKEYPLQPPVSFTASSTLYNLTEGNHTLRAYLFGSDGRILSTERIFIVDSSYKNPELTLISPKKLVYTTSEVQLIFSTNKAYKHARYILDYHLDPGAHYIDIDGNITLTNLTDGTHKLIFFADCYDEYHDGISLSQGTSFNVSINVNATKVEDTTEAQNNLTIDYKPIFLTAAAAAIVVAVAALVQLKKRKPPNAGGVKNP